MTTLAVQTAMLMLNSGGPRAKPSTCLLDLNFQNGTAADYLDLEPRLNLAEIEPRPDRLDRQLLEVMLSYHASGLAVIAAPNRPAEMRSFDPDVVTRLLDLVSANFDYVVFDMPRTWFSWTDSVLLGSNKLFIVSETTVPSLRHAKQLVAAIKERLGDGPNPQVIVNRFEHRMFSSGLRRGDLVQTLGDAFVAAIPNDYALVREAIDRGVPLDEVKPGNKVSAALKKLMLDDAAKKPQARSQDRADAASASCSRRFRRRNKRTEAMAGRFTFRRAAAPELPASEPPAPAADDATWSALPEAPPEQAPPIQPQAANPLLSDKLLDAKVRLHRRLIEEINLSALEKLPEEEIRRHVQQLVSQYVLAERLALNTQELAEFVSEILDEMTGLGPLEPLLKDESINDILINGHECVYVERARRARAAVGALQGRAASAAHHQ